MYVLGIETSCDETSAAIVKDGEQVFSNIVSSSIKFHRQYGGVVPEIASRKQLQTITQVTDSSLNEAKIKLKDIGLISVTHTPGLLGSLLVGLSFAKAASFSLGVPLLGINHVYAHIYANFLEQRSLAKPFVSLVVSGGHTSLFYVKDFDKIKTLGQTQDDACGEAFDKTARILGLGYPGGPVIERLARRGNPKKIRFKRSDTDRPLDFSFSGIKTAVLYYYKEKVIGYRKHRTPLIADIAASFQEAVVDTLIDKSLFACKLKKTGSLVIGGGVACNNRLREKFCSRARALGIKIYFPKPELCMDNAAMVAGLGYRLFKKGHCSKLDLNTETE